MTPPTTEPASAFRRLVDLALPIIGVNVLNVLALAVDTAMCGRLGDADTALTGLGFATQLVFLLLVLMMGLSIGTVALVARAYGAGDSEQVNHVLRQSSLMTALLGLGIAVAGNLLAWPLLTALGATEGPRAAALEYLRVLLWGSPFYYLTILYGATLRGVGNTRLAFMVALASNVVNFLLNYGLILGNFGLPALGLRGAAIGTVCSQVFSVAVMVTLLRRGAVPNITVSLRPEALDRPLLRRLFSMGAPAAMDMVILNAAFLSIIGMLGRIDQLAVAAHGIGLRIQALAFVPGLSVSQATGALVGQALGAGDVPEARKVVRASVLLCTAVMCAIALSILLNAERILGLFDIAAQSPLGEHALTWIRLLGYGFPVVGVHIALVGVLQGAGATGTSLRINMIGTLAFQIPLGALLGFVFDLGVFGVWVAFPLSFVLRAVLAARAYQQGAWAVTGR